MARMTDAEPERARIIQPILRLKRGSASGLVRVTMILLVMSGSAAAGHHVLTAPEALRQVEAGTLVLIDVRSPGEWRETGLPHGAVAISIHDPRGRDGFVEKVGRTVSTGHRAATICATGIRSERARSWLLGAGFQAVFNIREGMLGR